MSERAESVERLDDIGDLSDDAGDSEGDGQSKPPLLARLLFGGFFAFNGLNHLKQPEGLAGYAEAKGVPEAERMVPLSGGMLLLSGLGIVLWRVPKFFAGALAAFLATVTPVMHDFWNADEESKQNEMTQFLKNVALLGAALAFIDWSNNN